MNCGQTTDDGILSSSRPKELKIGKTLSFRRQTIQNNIDHNILLVKRLSLLKRFVY